MATDPAAIQVGDEVVWVKVVEWRREDRKFLDLF